MFAIVKTGGKQYKIAANDRIKIEKLDFNEGDKVTLDQVLFIQNDNGEVVFGSPIIEGAKVEAEILRNFKDKKVIIFKKRRRQSSRRKRGHRQLKTEVRIISINP